MEAARSLDTGKTDGIVVRKPRQTDAIGGALRSAYGSRIDLPRDLRRMLDRLDALPDIA